MGVPYVEKDKISKEIWIQYFKFMNRFITDPVMRRSYLQHMAVSITLEPMKRLPVIIGGHNNGKSTASDFNRLLLGKMFKTGGSEMLQPRADEQKVCVYIFHQIYNI